MHAIPSFQHPERVVLVCAEHDAGGERSPLAGLADAPARPRRDTSRMEQLARALSLGGAFFMALAMVLAVLYVVIHAL